eukprot:7338119-Prorocentrum_lima.AAC.1
MCIRDSSLDERNRRMLLRCVACFGKGVVVITDVLAQLKQEGKCADEIVELSLIHISEPTRLDVI